MMLNVASLVIALAVVAYGYPTTIDDDNNKSLNPKAVDDVIISNVIDQRNSPQEAFHTGEQGGNGSNNNETEAKTITGQHIDQDNKIVTDDGNKHGKGSVHCDSNLQLEKGGQSSNDDLVIVLQATDSTNKRGLCHISHSVEKRKSESGQEISESNKNTDISLGSNGKVRSDDDKGSGKDDGAKEGHNLTKGVTVDNIFRSQAQGPVASVAGNYVQRINLTGIGGGSMGYGSNGFQTTGVPGSYGPTWTANGPGSQYGNYYPSGSNYGNKFNPGNPICVQIIAGGYGYGSQGPATIVINADHGVTIQVNPGYPYQSGSSYSSYNPSNYGYTDIGSRSLSCGVGVQNGPAAYNTNYPSNPNYGINSYNNHGQGYGYITGGQAGLPVKHGYMVGGPTSLDYGTNSPGGGPPGSQVNPAWGISQDKVTSVQGSPGYFSSVKVSPQEKPGYAVSAQSNPKYPNYDTNEQSSSSYISSGQTSPQ